MAITATTGQSAAYESIEYIKYHRHYKFKYSKWAQCTSICIQDLFTSITTDPTLTLWLLSFTQASMQFMFKCCYDRAQDKNDDMGRTCGIYVYASEFLQQYRQIVFVSDEHHMHSMSFQSNDKASFNSTKCPLNSSAILPSASATIVFISE